MLLCCLVVHDTTITSMSLALILNILLHDCMEAAGLKHLKNSSVWLQSYSRTNLPLRLKSANDHKLLLEKEYDKLELELKKVTNEKFDCQ